MIVLIADAPIVRAYITPIPAVIPGNTLHDTSWSIPGIVQSGKSIIYV